MSQKARKILCKFVEILLDFQLGFYYIITITKELLLGDRIYHCESCSLEIDRDLNAAINLRNYGLNKIREVIPEFTLGEREALVSSGGNETIFDEPGISGIEDVSDHICLSRK